MKGYLASDFLKVTNDGFFIIDHTGGKVQYRLDNFVEKNRNFLSGDLIEVMRKSKNANMKSLFLNKMTKTGSVITEDGYKSIARRGQQDPLTLKKQVGSGRLFSGFADVDVQVERNIELID